MMFSSVAEQAAVMRQQICNLAQGRKSMLSLYLTMLEDPEDKRKFEQIYHQYERKMYAVALKILQQREDAEDIVHESFCAVIENIEKISDVSCHETWNYIVTIVKNKSLNHIKSRNRSSGDLEENFLLEQLTDEQDMEALFVEQERNAELAKLILKLPETYRYVLYLYYYQEMSYTDIAKSLDMTADNARQVAVRARKLLAKQINKEDADGMEER